MVYKSVAPLVITLGFLAFAGSGVSASLTDETDAAKKGFGNQPLAEASFRKGSPGPACAANPNLMTTCYINGDPLPVGSAAGSGDTVVQFDFNGTTKTVIATASQTGAVWGLAYDVNQDRLFMSAVIRRHSGLGPSGSGNGIGAIYISSPPSGAPTLFYDMAAHVSVGTIGSNSARGLGTSTSAPSHDSAAFALVGKAGLGDIEINADGSTLYVVNLGDRRVYAINTANTTAAPTALPAFPDPGCVNGVARPWGLTFHDGVLYAGVVCTAENASGTASNLSAHVFSWNGGASWTTALSFPLNYTRENSYPGFSGNWNPWRDTVADINPATPNGELFFSHPSPIFSDLQILDDDSIVMGFLDRTAMQFGARNYGTDVFNTTTFYYLVSGGDILRASSDGDGTFTLESNASVGGIGPTAGAGTMAGPGGGEFYFGDSFLAPGEEHREASFGSLSFLPGSSDVIMAALDPTAFDSGGIYWLNNTTGAKTRVQELYRGANNGNGAFGKAVGLGDLELLCGTAPAMDASIGDFVWNDLDGDGVQDAGEPGINGVTLDLIGDTNGNGAIDGGEPVLSTQTTAGGGAYNFTGLSAGNYLVNVTDTGNVLSGFMLTGGTNPHAVSLTASQDYNDADFGYQMMALPMGSIGDFVWNDLDGDGVQDAGEPGINGVTLDLIDDANGNGVIDGGESVLSTQTTAGGGAYDFTGLAAGDYLVTVTDTGNVLTGFVLTGGTDPVAVTLVADQDVNTADFGYQQQNATLGDFVWNDLDGDGVQDAGEPGINGVTLDLIGDTNGNGTIDGGEPVLSTQTTAGGGAYDFTNLPAGDYLVIVTDTGNVLTGFVLTGGTNPQAVSLTAGQDVNTADFGYQQQNATLGDFVWNDLDGDGVQDAGEPGINGVTLDLIGDTNGNGTIDGGEPVLSTQTTAGGGAYDFTNLPAGDYLVIVTDTGNVLAGFVLTGGTNPQAVSLTAGQDVNTADFGYQMMPLPTGSIGDFVWNDLDGDGVQDAGEPGIDGVTLNLIDDANGNGAIDGGEPVLSTQTTAGGGAYDFTGLTAGDYLVNVTDTGNVLTGFVLTGGTNPHAVSLTAGQDVNTADFGYQQADASLGDFVWNDLNGDGVQDAGEPGIDGVTLNLIDDANGNGAIDGGEAVLDTQTTVGGGAYDFTGLTAGDYLVTVTDTGNVLTGFVLTGGTNPHAVSLTAGQDYNDADFGYQQGDATLGDFVWNDLNGDGVQDAGEPGIDGVTLNLIDDANGNGQIDGGEAILDTQTTAGGGAYDFTGLTAGDYLVNVTDTGNVLTGFVLTGGTNPHAVSLTAGQDYNDADFGYQQGDATLGDFVWNDLNGDGVQDAGEPGIDGVTLNLIDDANGNGQIDGGEAVLDTQTTAGGGAYDFTSLTAGDYLVNVTDTGNVLTGFVLTGGTNPHAVSLTAGQDYNDADFGYQQGDATLGDFVWNDLNGDGVQDAGEPGIDGVTLNLIDDANGNGQIDGGEAVLDTQTTAGGGAYDFTGLTAGDYLVNVTDTGNVLTGFVLTGGTNPHAVSLTAGQDYNDADFGYQQGDATLGDFVWNDLNGDGVQDAGEPGIDGVTLNLIDDANGNGQIDGGEAVLDTQTTAGGGAYDFTGLTAGDYLVNVTDTGNVLTGFVLTGGTNPHAVSLTAGQDYNDADFGYQQGDATLGDFVWNDLNGDGIQDAGEPGIDGVTLNLIDDANGNGAIDGGEPVLSTQTTAGGGAYDFTGLTAGDYLVNVTDTGNVLTGFVLTGGTNPHAVSLTAGQDYNEADFGYQQGDATLGDFVWNDLNGDGVQDAGEPGIDGVTLNLIDDANGNGAIDGGEPVLSTQTTAGGGAYDFTGLTAGDYLVNVTDTGNVLTGFVLTGGTNPHAVSLTAGQDYNEADFGYQQGDATLGDFVWNDLNGDGVQDAGEPGIDGVTLNLIDDANGNGQIDGGEAVLSTQTTAGGGAYDFTGLTAGDYLVTVTDTGNVLTGFVLTGGTNPHAVSLTAGQDYNDADFGYQRQSSSIGDFVWNDLNGDGVQDAGEPGFDGVTLDLIDDANGNGQIDGGEAVLDTQTTAGGGAYDFTGLPVGDYIVTVTDTGGILTDYQLTGGTEPHAVSLAKDQDYNDADFGYQRQSSSIGDFVWNDLNGDGIQDAGEPGFDGVTLDLIDDANGNGQIDGGEAVLSTQTTAGGGAYDFTGLTVGDYIVTVTDTGGILTDYQLTGGTEPHAVTLAKDQDYNEADFGYQRQSSSIGDFVWNDLNGDGIQDAGEPGFDGVTLDLIDDANGNGQIDGGEAVLSTQTTAGGGAYDFTGLTVGDYIVTVTDTGGILTDYQLTGGTEPHAVSLAKDQDYNDADFGYQRQSSSIGDFVWNDLNGDGIQDAGEPGFDGVTLDLIDDANGNGQIDGGEAVLSTQTTAGGGAYDFTGLTVGDYIVTVTDTGGILTDYQLTGGTEPHAVSLAKDQDYNDADFGYQRQSSSIGDFVWNDLNGDGIQDAGEPGFDGVTLDLIDDANGNGQIDGGEAVLSTQTTAGGGAYDFTGLTVGDYIVTVTDTGGILTDYQLTGGTEPHAVSLAKDQDYNDADFGYQRVSASIGDLVWHDYNSNGLPDKGEPGLDGVTLDLIDDANGNGQIDAGEAVLSTQTTAGGGAYNFTGLAIGDYIVDVTDTGNVLDAFVLTTSMEPFAVTSLAKNEDFDDADFGYVDTRPTIGVSKAATFVDLTITYAFQIENFGVVDLFDLTMPEDLDQVFGAGNYQLLSAPTITEGNAVNVTGNPGFNGSSDTELLGPDSDLAVGESFLLTIVVEIINPVFPNNGPAVYENQVTITATGPLGNPVMDDSTDGDDPDMNGNGNPGDDGSPTVIMVPMPVPTLGEWGLGILLISMMAMALYYRRKSEKNHAV